VAGVQLRCCQLPLNLEEEEEKAPEEEEDAAHSSFLLSG